MALITKAIKGTQDVLPAVSHKNQYVEETMLRVAQRYGFREIRTPVFEHTELFQRGVGDTTDVVQKEMYTFEDKGGRSITLRPEGTAGAMRAFLEHGLFNEALPQKVSYLTSCYRYEKPQAGRLREFHQFGVECLGASEPAADAELIGLAQTIFETLGVEDLSLEINSIGCPECRKEYHAALKAYFESHREELCPTCLERLDKNPMRILDCKSPVCGRIAAQAPVVLDYLCDDCRTHFDRVKAMLDSMNVPYAVNPRIVRGLDYYTRTVFEFVSDSIGAQGMVCGGGRYDGLAEELGGPHVPSLGFALGIERLLLVMHSQGIEFPQPDPCMLYIAAMGERAACEAASIAQSLRASDFPVEIDTCGRSLKAQMKYAGKLGAQYTVVLGDNELDAGVYTLKNMQTGEEMQIAADEFIETFVETAILAMEADLKEMFGLEE